MNLFNKTSILSLLMMPTLTYAFFCPNNFSQINIGDTIDQVRSLCPPDKEETKTVEQTVPQEWNYYIPQTVSMGADQQESGTLKTTIAFDKDGKAINLSVNGIGVGTSTICGKAINLGDTTDMIKAACGDPAFINKEQAKPQPTGKESKIFIFTYNSNPPVQLFFENGLLSKKQ